MKWASFLITICFLAAYLCGCGGSGVGQDASAPQNATVTLSFRSATRVPISEIKTMTVTIAGVYMTDIKDTFDFSPSTTFTRTYQVPVGISRKFHIEANDAGGKVVYKGEKVQDIVAGPNTVTIDLYTTDTFAAVPIEVTIPNVPLSLGGIFGFGFSPYMDGQNPNSGSKISEDQIVARLDIIKPWCSAIRTFGCTDGLERVGPLAKAKGFYVIIGVWLGTNKSVNDQQIANAIAVANAGGCDAVSVGSEVLLRGDMSEGDLIAYIRQVKDAVSVPVTTGDTGVVLASHPAVCQECEEFILANFYPYWEGVVIDNALNSLKAAYASLAAANPGKEIIVGEAGWPTSGNTVGQAVPSNENARRFFVDIVTWAKANSIKIYGFEAFDEKWKIASEGPQGGAWGIFDSSGVMKPTYHEVMF